MARDLIMASVYALMLLLIVKRVFILKREGKRPPPAPGWDRATYVVAILSYMVCIGLGVAGKTEWRLIAFNVASAVGLMHIMIANTVAMRSMPAEPRS